MIKNSKIYILLWKYGFLWSDSFLNNKCLNLNGSPGINTNYYRQKCNALDTFLPLNLIIGKLTLILKLTSQNVSAERKFAMIYICKTETRHAGIMSS
jgi:hypothetical protein